MSKNTQISELINYISVDGSGNVVFTTVPAAASNTDKFLVSDAGTLKFRTAAQLLSDIGAQASGSYQAALSGTGFVKISGSTISYDNSTYLTTSSASSTYLPLVGGTLTGGLIGTTASFSSFITAQSTGGSGLRVYGGSGTNQWDVYLNSTNLRFSDNTGTGSVVFDRPISGTSATFSSSVTASGGFVANMGSTNIEGLIIQRANTSSNAIIKFRNNATDTWILGNRNTGDETFRLYNYNVGSDVLTVTNGGNVGIGTTSPGRKLDVNGVTRSNAFDIYYNSVTSGFLLTETQWTGGAGANNVSLVAEGGVTGGGNITFFTNGSAAERMRITSGGDVLIGDTTAAARLWARRTDDGNTFGVRATNASYSATVGFFGADRNTTNNSFYYIDCYNYGSSSYRFRVADSGAITSASSVTAVTQGLNSDFNAGAFIARASGSTTKYTQIGFDATNTYGWIQALEQGVAYRNLILNGAGGNVGIGTINPTEKIEVKGNIRLDSRSKVDSGEIDNITFTKDRPDASTGTYEMGAIRSFTYGGYAGGLTFYSGRHVGNGNYGLLPVITIGSTSHIGLANAGIGTTAPIGKLHILNASGTGQPVLELQQSNSGSNILQWKGSAGSYLGTITNDGTLSINTTAGPVDASTQKLQVYGAIRQDVMGTSYGEGYLMNFPANGTNYGGLFMHQTSTAMTAVGASSIKWQMTYNYAPELGVGNGGLAFTTANTNTRLFLASGGNVLVGTTSDNGNKFQVNGSSYLGTNAIFNNSLNGTSGQLGFTVSQEFGGTSFSINLASLLPNYVFSGRAISVILQVLGVSDSVNGTSVLYNCYRGSGGAWTINTVSTSQAGSTGVSSVSGSGTTITVNFNTTAFGVACATVINRQ